MDKITIQYGLDSRDELVEELLFTYHYEENGEELTAVYTGAELGVNNIFPYSTRSNYVPWVIVYEPMICTYLANSDISVFLTATEYAMTQGTMYNWHTVKTDRRDTCTYYGVTYPTGRLYPQCMQSMVFRTLPSSVTLRESWFGYGTMDPVGNNSAASIEDIISKGGWGMGYLSPMATPEIRRRIEGYGEPEEGDLGAAIILPENGYTADTDVITSVRVSNYLGDVTTEENAYLILTVTDEQNGEILFSGIKENIAVPETDETLVWFRWHTPPDRETCIIVTAEVYAAGLEDVDPSDNVDIETVDVVLPVHSDTPTPEFGDRRPAGFGGGNEPLTGTERTGWRFWEWDEGVFTEYCVSVLSQAELTITPDPDIKSTVYSGGTYTVRSGYGYEMSGKTGSVISVKITKEYNRSADEINYPDKAVESGSIYDYVVASVTGFSVCLVYYPEFSWSHDTGKFTSAEKTGNSGFVFAGNTDAEGDRIHYMPLWYPDGLRNYYVFASFEGLWTPGGELNAVVRSNAFSVNGSLYDDWYVGR